MCDYSLMNLPNRLAVEGEELVAHRFPSGSMGLASPSDLHPKPKIHAEKRRSFWAALSRLFNPESCTVPAVCIPPSTRLRLHDINERMRREHGLEAEEDCVFEQLTAAANTYRDAVRFGNGCCVRIQELTEGQRVCVLDMMGHGEDAPAAAGLTAALEDPLHRSLSHSS